MGAELVTIPADRLPLCPQYTGNPADPLHTLAALVLNAFYDAAPKDGNGFFRSPDVEKAYEAAQAKFGDRMLLYRAVVSVTERPPQTVIESWYFRCQVCGYTLPAGRAAS